MKLTSWIAIVFGIGFTVMTASAFAERTALAKRTERLPLTAAEKLEINQLLSEHRCAIELSPCTPEETVIWRQQIDVLVDHYCALPDYAQYCIEGPDARNYFLLALSWSAMPEEEYDEMIGEFAQLGADLKKGFEQADIDAAKIEEEFQQSQAASEQRQKDEEAKIMAEFHAEQAQSKLEWEAQQAEIDEQNKRAEQQRQWDEMWKKRNEDAIQAELLALEKQKVAALRVKQQQEEAQLLAEQQQDVAYHQSERQKWAQEGRIGDYNSDNNLSTIHAYKLQNLRSKHATEMRMVQLSAAEIASLKRAAMTMWAAATAEVAATAVVGADGVTEASRSITDVVSEVVRQYEMQRAIQSQ